METNAQKLRQKAINLLYLIFLAFLFSFIPSDFVDTTYMSNSSMNLLCNEVERQSTKYNMMVLSYVQQDEELFNETKMQLIEIDEKTNGMISVIEKMKLELVTASGFNKFGYLLNGKSENPSNNYMISARKAEALYKALAIYKAEMANLVPGEYVATLDSILPLPAYTRSSDGDYIKSIEFYFKKNPLNVAILNLSHFKSMVERVRTYTVGKLVQEISYTKPKAVPEEIVRIIMEDSALLGNLEFIRSFRLSAKPDKSEKPEGASFLSVESISDSVYAVGKPVRYYVDFDTSKPKPVEVLVQKPGGGIQSYRMNRPGAFMFVPEQKGYYRITFNNQVVKKDKFLKVMDLEPVLQNNQMGTLYIGIDNALNIKTSEFEDTEGLSAKISEGQILQKGKNFYARVFKPGIVTVEVFAKMPFGFVKVADKNFVVRELTPPVATLLGLPSGSSISAANISKLRSLEIKSDEYLVKEQFFVSGYEFTIIFNNHTSILQPIVHSGNSLNTVSTEALKKVRPGDVLIFNKIKAKSSLGKEINVSPLTYTIE